MTWTATACDHLKYALPRGGTSIEFSSAAGTTDLCALIGSPPAKHVVLDVYTAAGSETIIAHSCAGGAVRITRAAGGTREGSWPAGACVRTVQVVDAPICALEPDECCPTAQSVFAGLTVCAELDLDLSEPQAPVLCLKPSGVVAGDRCGGRLRVDQYGRITYMAPDFPAACLPVFDPCGCGGGSGGGVALPISAADVTFSSEAGCLLPTTSVQNTIATLEATICAMQAGSGGGVVSVLPGAGIAVTGGPSTPVVGLQDTIAAGTYGGFTVNTHGQIIGYSAPAGGGPGVVGAGAVSVTPNASGDYEVSVQGASETQPGVVQLASVGDLATNTPIPSDRVISWAFLQAWWDRTKNFICSLASVSSLTAAERATAKLALCVNGDTVAVSPDTLLRAGGAPLARVLVSTQAAPGSEIVTADNVTAVTTLGAGAAMIAVLSSPAPSMNYHVYVQHYGGTAPVHPLVTRLSTTQFRIEWFDVTGTPVLMPAAMAQWSAIVVVGEP